MTDEVNREHHRGAYRNQLIADISSTVEHWKGVDCCSLGNLQLTEKLIVLARNVEKTHPFMYTNILFYVAKKIYDVVLSESV